MQLKNQISITADSGVGSTTTSKVLHNYLGLSPWRWVNAGAIMRVFASEAGMNIEEFAKYSASNPEEKCDGMITYFGEQDYVIFEGRLVHHFAPHAFHVLLVCSPLLRASRRTKDFPEVPANEMLNMIAERDRLNTERYVKIYGEEVLWPKEKFDLVLDTGEFPPEKICKKIIDNHKDWLGKKIN